MLSVGVTVLTACTLAWYSGLPEHLDLVRVVPTLGGWALMMVVGADAIASASGAAGTGLDRFRKVDPLLRTRQLLEHFGVDPDHDTVRTLALTLLRPRQLLPTLSALLLTPAAATLVGSAVNPPDAAQFLGRFVAAVVLSAVAFAGWVWLSYLVANRQLFDAGLITALALLFLAKLFSSVAAAVLQQQPPPSMAVLARVTLSMILITIPPLFIHGIGAFATRAVRAIRPHRTAVTTVVAAGLLRRFNRQLTALEQPPARTSEPLAVVALILIPVPPLAFLMANAAHARLRTTPNRRGTTLAVAVRWTAVALLLAPVIPLLICAYGVG